MTEDAAEKLIDIDLDLAVALRNLQNAQEFKERVEQSSGSERAAVGTDHLHGLERCAKAVVDLLPVDLSALVRGYGV